MLNANLQLRRRRFGLRWTLHSRSKKVVVCRSAPMINPILRRARTPNTLVVAPVAHYLHNSTISNKYLPPRRLKDYKNAPSPRSKTRKWDSFSPSDGPSRHLFNLISAISGSGFHRSIRGSSETCLAVFAGVDYASIRSRVPPNVKAFTIGLSRKSCGKPSSIWLASSSARISSAVSLRSTMATFDSN